MFAFVIGGFLNCRWLFTAFFFFVFPAMIRCFHISNNCPNRNKEIKDEGDGIKKSDDQPCFVNLVDHINLREKAKNLKTLHRCFTDQSKSD